MYIILHGEFYSEPVFHINNMKKQALALLSSKSIAEKLKVYM